MAESPDMLDRLIADAARDGAAESFGPYFAERTVQRARAKRPAPAPRFGLLRPALALAAVVLLLVTGDWLRPRSAAAPIAEVRVVDLPDGTSVTLAPGSRLQWNTFRLRSKRAVDLVGEGFFDVASDGREFSVSTFNARVVVTGTRFNVRSWPGAHRPETWVALEEGSVRVEHDVLEAVTLRPGQSALAQNGRLALAADRNVEDAVSWQEGGLSLIDLPLRDALDALERRFDLKLEADPSVASRPTTYVNPQAGQAEDILDAICFALDLRYRPILGGFRVEP